MRSISKTAFNGESISSTKHPVSFATKSTARGR